MNNTKNNKEIKSLYSKVTLGLLIILLTTSSIMIGNLKISNDELLEQSKTLSTEVEKMESKYNHANLHIQEMEKSYGLLDKAMEKERKITTKKIEDLTEINKKIKDTNNKLRLDNQDLLKKYQIRVSQKEKEKVAKQQAQKEKVTVASNEKSNQHVTKVSSTSNHGYSNWKKMTMRASAYTTYENGDKLAGQGWGNLTASGKPVYWGGIAVDTNIIPMGTKVYIPKFNMVFTAIDTGSAIKGNRIDIYMNSLSECNAFGVQNLEVYVQ